MALNLLNKPVAKHFSKRKPPAHTGFALYAMPLPGVLAALALIACFGVFIVSIKQDTPSAKVYPPVAKELIDSNLPTPAITAQTPKGQWVEDPARFPDLDGDGKTEVATQKECGSGQCTYALVLSNQGKPKPAGEIAGVSFSVLETKSNALHDLRAVSRLGCLQQFVSRLQYDGKGYTETSNYTEDGAFCN
jgi:hypothetical protein